MSLAQITARIRTAEAAHGRAPGSVHLIAVSKVQPLDRVVAVLEEGHRVFGENYVQEAAGKWPDLRARFAGVQVHMIGPLQTNKAKQALELFDAIHSVDRPSLADKLARLVQDRGAAPEMFVQVNTGVEPQKAGVLPADLDAFLTRCRAKDLPVQGLMCIPPEGEDPSPHFALLAAMAARNGLAGLSMGMSSDFEAAIAHGATHIRVGSAIFGARSYAQRVTDRLGAHEVLEGPMLDRHVVIEFPTLAAARACYQSAEYQAARARREGAAVAHVVIVEGLG